jgi:hypothetical protein
MNKQNVFYNKIKKNQFISMKVFHRINSIIFEMKIILVFKKFVPLLFENGNQDWNVKIKILTPNGFSMI